MTDDLLSQFRSEVPLPNDASTRRIYARATSTRARHNRRALALAVVVTATCAALGVAALAGAFQGGGSQLPPPAANGDHLFAMVPAFNYTRTDGKLTSIDFTVNDDHFTAAALSVQVVHTDVPLDQLPGTNPRTEVVFSEQVPMTDTGSREPDTAWWTSSGTLSPSDWSGGCGKGSYGVRFSVHSAESSPSADPFSVYRDQTGFFWFRCDAS
jgi:hypothetical protein